MKNRLVWFGTQKRASDVENGTSHSQDGSNSTVDKIEEVSLEDNQNENVLTLTMQPHHASVGMQNAMKTQVVCATLQACQSLQDDNDRAPIDLMVALDVSGSMGGEKLDLCKRTLEMLLKALGPNDRFGLVSFGTSAQVDCKLQKLTPQNKSRYLEIIHDIQTRGMTNISDAIDEASKEIRGISNPNEVQSILLLTDGQANHGISHHADLVKFTEACLKGTHRPAGKAFNRPFFKRRTKGTYRAQLPRPKGVIHDLHCEKRSREIGLICFGYGVDHEGSLLREMAQLVRGSYYFIEQASDVGSAFGDAMGGLLSVVARSVIIKIQLPDEAKEAGVRIVKVHHQKESVEHNTMSGSYHVSLGDFYAEESRDVLVELEMATKVPKHNDSSVDASVRIPHLVASGTFFNTLEGQEASLAPVFCHIERQVASDERSERPNPHVHAQWLRIRSLETMKEIGELGSAPSNLPIARRKLKGLGQELDDAASSEDADNPVILQLKEDMDKLGVQMSTAHIFKTTGTKYLSERYQTHGMQRCMDASSKTANIYRGAKKKSMANAWNID